VWGGLLDLILPPRCLLCERPPDQGRFCARCQSAIFEDTSLACPRCAATIGPFSACAFCRTVPLHFSGAMRLGIYAGILRDVVLRLKWASSEWLAELLGEEWGRRHRATFASLCLTAIVPIPLHWSRRLMRGYNQAQAIGRGLSRTIGVPLHSRRLWRLRATPDQKSLGGPARRENLRGAFAVSRGLDLTGQRVLLVDDVMTTGATCNESGKELKKAGADLVHVAVLARTTDEADQG